jgi:TM2 domain-containing membrane protein YozV/ribosomal protein L37E
LYASNTYLNMSAVAVRLDVKGIPQALRCGIKIAPTRLKGLRKGRKAMHVICPHCGRKNRFDVDFEAQTHTCEACGTILPSQSQQQISPPPLPMGSSIPRFQVRLVGEGLVYISGQYSDAYEALRQLMIEDGGVIKIDDMESGIVEAAWKYGVNPFGLRITGRFNSLPNGKIQASIKGNFRNAPDALGSANEKARKITDAFVQKFSVHDYFPDHQASPPPLKLNASIPPNLPFPGDTPYQGKQKMSAGLLAIFLGGIGIHKFYLGSWGWGIIYIFFSWTWIPLIVGLFEGIGYLCMKKETFDMKYNYVASDPFKW